MFNFFKSEQKPVAHHHQPAEERPVEFYRGCPLGRTFDVRVKDLAVLYPATPEDEADGYICTWSVDSQLAKLANPFSGTTGAARGRWGEFTTFVARKGHEEELNTYLGLLRVPVVANDD